MPDTENSGRRLRFDAAAPVRPARRRGL